VSAITNEDERSRPKALKARRSRARFLKLLPVVIAVAAMGALGGISWHYSDELLTPVRAAGSFDLRILRVEDREVTLPRTEATSQAGTFGLSFQSRRGSGYGKIGRVISAGQATVTRRYVPLHGRITPDARARVDTFVWQGNPRTALGIPFTTVPIRDDLGTFPAWHIRGGDGWVIFVHGRGSSRAEALRLVPLVHGLNRSALVITYRNDDGVPPSPDGLYHLGASEWHELAAAVRFARSRGAKRIALVGYSMGGAIVCEFLRHSSMARFASAAVLDAPVLNWDATLHLAGAQRNLPSFLIDAAELAVEQRTAIDFDDLDQIRHASEFRVPILLWHGTADDKVPITASRAFARARPGLVTYEEVPGAGHVQAYNVAKDRYLRTVEGFLRAHT
jgi:pimeloyl-ACP methyl ester carboxylesterase